MHEGIALAQNQASTNLQQESVSGDAVYIMNNEQVNIENTSLQEELVEMTGETAQFITTNLENSTQMRTFVADGHKSNNINAQHYYTVSQPINSYLFQNEDGGLTRAEYINGEFIVEMYDISYSIKNLKILQFSQNTVFGGFYHGERYNYIMLGHTDADNEKNIPQYELQMYDSTFTLLNIIPVSGINSKGWSLFGETNVRFEESGGFLYVRTGHVLGNKDLGEGHQESLYFIFDTVQQVLLYVDDICKGITYGDVSHTLNRFLRLGEEGLYVAEQQDFNPGGVYLLKLPFYQRIKETVPYALAVDFPVDADTYVLMCVDGTIGGMELSKNSCLIVGSYKNRGSSEWERNIFVSVTPLNEKHLTSKKIYLTDYEQGSRVVAMTPQLIKVSDNRFMVLWSNYYVPDKEGAVYYDECESETCYLLIDGEGNRLTDIITIDAFLSDCQPILYNDNIVWYYTVNSSPMFIQIPTDGSKPVWNSYKLITRVPNL